MRVGYLFRAIHGELCTQFVSLTPEGTASHLREAWDTGSASRCVMLWRVGRVALDLLANSCQRLRWKGNLLIKKKGKKQPPRHGI